MSLTASLPDGGAIEGVTREELHAASFATQLAAEVGWESSYEEVAYMYGKIRRRAWRHGELGLSIEGSPPRIELRGLRTVSVAHKLLAEVACFPS